MFKMHNYEALNITFRFQSVHAENSSSEYLSAQTASTKCLFLLLHILEERKTNIQHPLTHAVQNISHISNTMMIYLFLQCCVTICFMLPHIERQSRLVSTLLPSFRKSPQDISYLTWCGQCIYCMFFKYMCD